MHKQHILCFGDSNTFGRCADPAEYAGPPFSVMRFAEDVRWPCLLQKHLGEAYLVIEEGLNGRTTVFRDPLLSDVAAIDYMLPCLKSHMPLSLLILMLGTNDVKRRFQVCAEEITLGMQTLAELAANAPVWAGEPNILIVAPAPLGKGMPASPLYDYFGEGCVEKSLSLADCYARMANTCGYAFLDAGMHCITSEADCVHLTKQSHIQLASAMADAVEKRLHR